MENSNLESRSVRIKGTGKDQDSSVMDIIFYHVYYESVCPFLKDNIITYTPAQCYVVKLSPVNGNISYLPSMAAVDLMVLLNGYVSYLIIAKLYYVVIELTM